MRVILQSDIYCWSRVSGDQVKMMPKLELPLKRRRIWPQTARISRRFVNNYLKYKASASIVISWGLKS